MGPRQFLSESHADGKRTCFLLFLFLSKAMHMDEKIVPPLFSAFHLKKEKIFSRRRLHSSFGSSSWAHLGVSLLVGEGHMKMSPYG